MSPAVIVAPADHATLPVVPEELFASQPWRVMETVGVPLFSLSNAAFAQTSHWSIHVVAVLVCPAERISRAARPTRRMLRKCQSRSILAESPGHTNRPSAFVNVATM